MIDTTKLRHVAAKLRQMWGNNPDSILIEEAAAELDSATPEPTPTPKAATKRTPKETK